MTYNVLVRRTFGPLQDWPRAGTPFVDHGNRTISTVHYSSSSNPVLAQQGAATNTYLNNQLASQSARHKQALYQGQALGTVWASPAILEPKQSYAEKSFNMGMWNYSSDAGMRGLSNPTRDFQAHRLPTGGTSRTSINPNGTVSRSSSWDPFNLYGPMARDYGQTQDWARASFNNLPGQRKSMSKRDMGGGTRYRTLAERSYGYDSDLASLYQTGKLTDDGLFHAQMRRNVLYDTDQIGSSFNYTSGLNARARANITFGRSGRVSFSGSFGSGGTSFSY